MPIEPSPIPFGSTLPYTPLFDPSAPPEIAPNGSVIGGGGSGMGMGMGAYSGTLISHGPASVAASAIIGPTPGGLAGPHRPIPALPDAGYTAPTFRAASLTGHAHQYGGLQGYGQSEVQGQGPGSVYAGGSLYGGGGGGQIQNHQPPYAGAQGSVYSDGWSASLPAPRRAPIVCDPNPHHSPAYDSDRGRHHDRSPTHHRHHSKDEEFDDGASDASYYAMPRKPSRHTRASSQDSSASELSSPEVRRGEVKEKDDLHRRTLSSNHQAQGRYRSPSASAPTSPGPHDHSPISPSPLRAKEREREERGPAVTRSRRNSLGPEDGLGLSGLEVDDSRGRRHDRRSAHTPNEDRSRSNNEEERSTRSVRPGMGRQKSNLRPVEGSISDSEQTRNRRNSVRRSTSRLRRRSKEYGDEVSEDEYSSEERRSRRSAKKSGETRRKASIRQSHGKHERDRRAYEEDESPYHRPTLPVDHSPLLSPHSALDYSENGSNRHEHHHHHHGRRRANSEHCHHHHRHHHQDQREYTPPPQAGTLYPGQSASLVGEDHGHHHHHQPQVPMSAGSRRSVGGQPFPGYVDGGQSVHPLPGHGMFPPNGQGFDDGASMVMDAQTMGGRVSQYGLPKYAHNPKVDYRRFCVQRGNADVFID